MNATMEKFGWPATVVAQFDHWIVLARPAQPTLGSLVLAARSDATAFSALEPAAYAELGMVTGAIETALAGMVCFEKINYLMLMMVDPHVHFHVIPRYEGSRDWDGTAFPDAGWPRTPDLAAAISLEPPRLAALVTALRTHFGQS